MKKRVGELVRAAATKAKSKKPSFKIKKLTSNDLVTPYPDISSFMPRNLSTKLHNGKQPTFSSQPKLRTSSSQKGGSTKSVSRSSNKGSHQPSTSSHNSKTNEYYTAKTKVSNIKKDSTEESSPKERQDPSHSSQEGLYHERNQKNISYKAKSGLLDLCQDDKQKVGDLIRKLAQEKETKENLQEEIRKKELTYERTIENLRKENQEIAQGTLEVQNDFRSSMGLLKSLDALSSKQRQQKLFSNLVSNKELFQRTCNYGENPLIANKENVFRQTDPTSIKSLNLLSDGKDVDSYVFPSQERNRYTDLELELELQERRNRACKADFLNDRKVSNQGSGNLDTPSYKFIKYQKLFEENKQDSSEKFLNQLDTLESQQVVSPPLKTSSFQIKETRIYQHIHKQDPFKSNTPKNYVGENDKRSESQQLAKKPPTWYSPNMAEKSLPVTETQEDDSKKENIPGLENMQQKRLGNEKASQNRTYFSSSHGFLENKLPPQHYSAHENVNSKTVDMGRENISPSRDIKRNSGTLSSTKAERESVEKRQERKDVDDSSREEKKVIPGVVDLGQMNVSQLIELKNIIDERIEIEELKNKASKLKKSPQAILQKADQILKSSENQRFSRSRSPLKELEDNSRNLPRKDEVIDRFAKTDNFFNKASSRNQSHGRTPLINIPDMNDYYINKNFRSSASYFYPTENNHEGSWNRANRSDVLLSSKRSQRHDISSEKEIEELYNQKLKEFLEVRDLMIKVKEIPSDQLKTPSLTGTTKEGKKISFDTKDTEALLSSNILFQFNSPAGSKESNNNITPGLSEKDLLVSPPNALNRTKEPQISNQSLLNNYMRGKKERKELAVEKVGNNKNFSFAKSGESSEKGSGLIHFGRKEDFYGNDLMKLVEQPEYEDRYNKQTEREKQKVNFETSDKLTKKELNRIISQANNMDDSPSDSTDLTQGDLLQKYSLLNAELSKNLFKPASLSKVLNQPVTGQEDVTSIGTPTLNHINATSGNTSSIVETDMSILAITNKLDEMREEMYDNKLY